MMSLAGGRRGSSSLRGQGPLVPGGHRQFRRGLRQGGRAWSLHQGQLLPELDTRHCHTRQETEASK